MATRSAGRIIIYFLFNLIINFIVNKSKANTKGFTLVEMIIYISIFAVILFIILQLFWQVQLSDVKGGVSREVKENASQVTEIIKRYVRKSDELNTNDSLFEVNPGVLVLEDNGQVIIDAYTKNVLIGNKYVNIRKLRLTEPGYSVTDITSDKVDVTDFTVSNLTQNGPNTVLINLGLSSVNIVGDPVYDDQISIRTSITIRQEI